jgi:glutaconate CoA-transferase subunit A
MAIRALEIDFGFSHAAVSDPFGNVQFVGGGFGDRAIARASGRVVCTVERVVTNDEIRRNPDATAIPGAHQVIHAPFGSHPFASPGHYLHDEPMLREYLAASGRWLRSDDRAALDSFLDQWMRGPDDHWDYLDRVGSARLYALSEGVP